MQGSVQGLQISGRVIQMVLSVVLFVVGVFALSDKSRIKQRVELLKGWEWYHSVISLVVAYVLSNIIGTLLNIIFGF